MDFFGEALEWGNMVNGTRYWWCTEFPLRTPEAAMVAFNAPRDEEEEAADEEAKGKGKESSGGGEGDGDGDTAKKVVLEADPDEFLGDDGTPKKAVPVYAARRIAEGDDPRLVIHEVEMVAHYERQHLLRIKEAAEEQAADPAAAGRGDSNASKRKQKQKEKDEKRRKEKEKEQSGPSLLNGGLGDSTDGFESDAMLALRAHVQICRSPNCGIQARELEFEYEDQQKALRAREKGGGEGEGGDRDGEAAVASGGGSPSAKGRLDDDGAVLKLGRLPLHRWAQLYRPLAPPPLHFPSTSPLTTYYPPPPQRPPDRICECVSVVAAGGKVSRIWRVVQPVPVDEEAEKRRAEEAAAAEEEAGKGGGGGEGGGGGGEGRGGEGNLDGGGGANGEEPFRDDAVSEGWEGLA